MMNHRRGDFLVPFLTVASDALAIEAAFLFSYWLRFRSWIFDSLGFLDANAPPISGYLAGSAFVILIWLLLFNGRKMYGGRRNVTLFDELVNVVKVVSIGMLIVMSAAFFYREFSYSRVVFGLLWTTSIVFITSGRAVVLWLERRLYRKGLNLQMAILVGSDSRANQVYSTLHGHPSFGIHIIGYFADAPAHEELTLSRAAYLGPVSGAPDYIQENGIDLAFLTLRSEDHAALFDLITACEGLTIEFMMVPDVLELLTSQVIVRELEGVPFLKIKGIPLTAWGRITKRTFDIVVTGLILLLLSPVMLVIALLIRLDHSRAFLRPRQPSRHGLARLLHPSRSTDWRRGTGSSTPSTDIGVLISALADAGEPLDWAVTLRGRQGRPDARRRRWRGSPAARRRRHERSSDA